MCIHFLRLSKLNVVVQASFIMAWLTNLAYTDAMFCVYVVCSIIGIFSLCDNYYHISNPRTKLETGAALLCSVLFSIVVLLANYRLFSPVSDLLIIFNLMCNLIGGIILAYNVLIAMIRRIPLLVVNDFRSSKDCNKVFFASFSLICIINLIHLFFVEYPGNLTNDSLTQLGQIISGEYINHHPFWHTMVIKVFFDIGNYLFHDYNIAVAIYAVGQIVFMAASFSYAVKTLYESGVPKTAVILVLFVYTLMPYNIAYSICMNKDVIFSGAVLLVVTSLYRIFRDVGKSRIVSYIIFALSGIGVCIWRSNGILAYAFCLILFFLFLNKTHRFVIYIMASVLVFSWGLTRPFLSYMNVSQTDLVESLSIPVQQVARVVYDGCDLSDEQIGLIDRVVDLEEIPTLYVDWLSDPIKDEIRSKNPVYFEDHISDYFKLWIKLGLEYPGEYFKAWIDQTKGYWNAGYDQLNSYSLGVSSNSFGIEEGDNNNIVANISHLIFKFCRGAVFMDPFESVGLHVWLLIAMLAINIIKRRFEALLAILPLAIILTLLVATPVSYAFRYAYPVFTSYPFISMITLYHYVSNGKEVLEG